MDDLRVLIVADDPLARAGLAALLAGRCAVVGQVAAGDDLLLDIYRPDVVLWDLGWEAAAIPERLADLNEGGTAVVALLPDDASPSDLWAAGTHGLLRRSADADQLVAALVAVAHKLAVFDPALVPSPSAAPPMPPLEALTARELEVLRLLAEGLPNKTIALRLNISEHTVKFHLNAILGKLHAQSRTEAVVQAIRLGLIAV